MKYQPVTPDILNELNRIVGEKHLIYGDEQRMAPYAHDEVADARFAHLPGVVVKPASAKQIRPS